MEGIFMSNFENEEVNPEQEAEIFEREKLSSEDIARLLGATVVIEVNNPWEALQVYRQRQAEIRSQAKNKAEE